VYKRQGLNGCGNPSVLRLAGTSAAYVSVNVANEDAFSIYKALGYRTIQVYQGYQTRIS